MAGAPMTLAEVIKRLDAGEDQDRTLDAIITYMIKPALARMGSLEAWLKTDASHSVPTYTWSLDDALTLVPKDAGWNVQGNTSNFHAMVNGYPGAASSPAIALCIAALRARDGGPARAAG
jgi:hypothetical protein